MIEVIEGDELQEVTVSTAAEQGVIKFVAEGHKTLTPLKLNPGLSGISWDYLGLSRFISDYLGLSWIIWDYLGLSLTIWDYLGLSGSTILAFQIGTNIRDSLNVHLSINSARLTSILFLAMM